MAEAKKDKHKFIKPSWLPWVLFSAELAIVLVVGILVIRAAMV